VATLEAIPKRVLLAYAQAADLQGDDVVGGLRATNAVDAPLDAALGAPRPLDADEVRALAVARPGTLSRKRDGAGTGDA